MPATQDLPVADQQDKTVIVTGAGTGLGRAITIRLLRDGFRCVLAGPEAADLEATIELADVDDNLGTAVRCDVRNPVDRVGLVATAEGLPGRLFGLVNNAGISRGHPLLDESLEDWRDTVETNLEAAFFLSQLAVERMREHREGRIVNIGSIYGIIGPNNRHYGARGALVTPGDRGPMRQSAYAASKGGLIQLTRALATAVGHWNITVNTVSPGVIPWANAKPNSSPEPNPAKKPGLGDRIDPEILATIAVQVPLQRTGHAEEVAGPVRFLLSDDASYVTGLNLVVDGGFTCW